MEVWQNFALTIQRDDLIMPDNDITIEALKKPTTADPLKEEVFIDQRDVEELDEFLLSI